MNGVRIPLGTPHHLLPRKRLDPDPRGTRGRTLLDFGPGARHGASNTPSQTAAEKRRARAWRVVVLLTPISVFTWYRYRSILRADLLGWVSPCERPAPRY